MIDDEGFEVDVICEAIIRDHLLFECCPLTFKTHSSRTIDIGDDMKDLVLRKEVRDFILSKESSKALELVADPKLKKALLKQSFVELVMKNRLEEALAVAEEYLKDFEDDDVFSVLGYKDLEDEEIRHYFSKESVESLRDMINENLFFKSKGRNASLMAIAWFHYKSIQSFLNK